LTERLLSSASVDIIAEKEFIAKLKAEAGVAYVTKMTAMLQDLDTSKAEMDKYKRMTHKGRPAAIELTVQVLGSSSWEIDKSKLENINVPNAIKFCMNDFIKFYTDNRSMYKLDFAFGLVYKIIYIYRELLRIQY
jgi:predicted MPP superfamily phosphohydrolase